MDAISKRNWVRWLVIVPVIWAILIAGVFINLWPMKPATWQGWLVFLVGAPAFYLFAEYLAHRADATRDEFDKFAAGFAILLCVAGAWIALYVFGRDWFQW